MLRVPPRRLRHRADQEPSPSRGHDEAALALTLRPHGTGRGTPFRMLPHAGSVCQGSKRVIRSRSASNRTSRCRPRSCSISGKDCANECRPCGDSGCSCTVTNAAPPHGRTSRSSPSAVPPACGHSPETCAGGLPLPPARYRCRCGTRCRRQLGCRQRVADADPGDRSAAFRTGDGQQTVSIRLGDGPWCSLDAGHTARDLITAPLRVRPEHAGRWPDDTADFTEATRREPGCLWVRLAAKPAGPTEYVLVEAFRDDEQALLTRSRRTSGPRSRPCRPSDRDAPHRERERSAGRLVAAGSEMAVHERGQDGLRVRSARVTGRGSAEQVLAAGRFAPLLSIDAVPLDGRAPVDLVPHPLDLADGPVLLA